MFPRPILNGALFLLLLGLSTTLAPAATAPYFEGFDTVPSNGVPANFVETPDSAWNLPPSKPGIYEGAVTASGADIAIGSSVNFTNVAGNNFTVKTTFTLQTNGGFDSRLAELGLVALAGNPDVTAGGYRLWYGASGLGDVYQKLFITGSSRGSVSSGTVANPAAGDQFTMTLHGAYIEGTLFLTGTLNNGSRTISVQMSDPAPLSGMNFGFRQRASASNFRTSSVTGDYDDFSVQLETRPVKFGNIATRLTVGTGNEVAIAGFIVIGNAPKRILLRGTGFGYPAPGLGDPTVELHRTDGQLLAFNDNWEQTQRAEIYATGLDPSGSESAALIAVLNPGAYTAILRGKNETSGTGILEVYDLDGNANSKLSNISTRGQVGIGDKAMIAGVIVTGDAKARVIVRAIGPSLADAGIAGQLADPTLELRDGNGATVRSNDNWRDSQEAEIVATGLQPTHEAEAAIVADLLPINYSAIVRGKNDTTGIALVEVYHLN